jgi:hypothetical protein
MSRISLRPAAAARLGMGDEPPPIAPALPVGRDRDVLDPQMIGPRHRLDEADKRAAVGQEIDRVLAHRAVIVRLHRQRLAADQRDPFGAGRARQVVDPRCVFGGGGRISSEGVFIGECCAALFAMICSSRQKNLISPRAKKEVSNHGIGRPGHVGCEGFAAPPFHRRRGRGDGRG